MNIYTIEFLIKLKNATLVRKEKIITPFNRLSLELIKCLYKEGFVQSFHIEKQSNEQKITVFLRFFYNKGLLKDLKIISTPSFIRHLTLQDICKLNTRKSVMFFSTSKGILTTLDCKKRQLGGSLLFLC
jgi:small subunit ribosomal protein S8